MLDGGDPLSPDGDRYVKDYPGTGPSVEPVDNCGVDDRRGTNRGGLVVADSAPDVDPRTLDQLSLDDVIGQRGPDGGMHDAELVIETQVVAGP
ncbi:uncharacterized protein METZ01_LOCUS223163 [marine metagenome]|uniref:Uncharacterized protein n=1 Tax=marine metagenome TaxID=408172 RepID=A0A382G5Z3_9ZZZZ